MYQKVVLQLLQLNSKYAKQLDRKLSLHGISLTEFQIMKTLQSAPNKVMRRIDLANAVGLTASGVTRLLAPMEKIGLVVKKANPRDARVSLIELTEAGATTLEDAKVTFDMVCEEVNYRLTENQQEKLSQFLETLL
ncbi:MAG: MarR family transcriptional regulator [Reinekea sp.]|jgi:DNA-binding MarR family transcriptional regulator